MELILVSMDRGGPYLYTGRKYRDIRGFVSKIQGGGCNNLPSEDVLQKIPQEDEGWYQNKYQSFMYDLTMTS